MFQEDASASCLVAVGRVLERIPELLRTPRYADRADPSRFVDAYVSELTEVQRRVVADGALAARGLWSRLQEAETKQQVTDTLDELFGASGEWEEADRAVLVAPSTALRGLTDARGRDAGEQFLGDYGIPIDLQHAVKIDAHVHQNGFRKFRLLGVGYPVMKNASLEFFIESCNVPLPFEVKWKVKNTGEEALRVSQLRGEIYDDGGSHRRTEPTKYWGNHYVECYIIKNGTCVAADHIDVPIGWH